MTFLKAEDYQNAEGVVESCVRKVLFPACGKTDFQLELVVSGILGASSSSSVKRVKDCCSSNPVKQVEGGSVGALRLEGDGQCGRVGFRSVLPY